MIQQPFTKTTKQPMSINLGKGPFMQKALQTDTIHFLVTQKPLEIIRWAAYKFYKTTQRPGVAEQHIAKSPDPNGSGLLRFIYVRFKFWRLIGYTTTCCAPPQVKSFIYSLSTWDISQLTFCDQSPFF